MTDKNKQRNQRRKFNYNRLIEVGFSSKEATAYKDRAIKIVEALCELKRNKDKELLDGLQAILSRKVKS